MKRLQRQFWSLLLCIAMILTLLPGTAVYADGDPIGDGGEAPSATEEAGATALAAPIIELASDEMRGGLSFNITPVEEEVPFISGYRILMYDADGNGPVGEPVVVSAISGNLPVSDSIQAGADYTAKAAAVARAGSGFSDSGYGSLCQPQTVAPLPLLTTPTVILSPNTEEGGLTFLITPEDSEADLIDGYVLQLYDAAGENPVGIPLSISGTSGTIPLSDSVLVGTAYTARAAAIAKTSLPKYMDSEYGVLSAGAKAAKKKLLATVQVWAYPTSFLIRCQPADPESAIEVTGEVKIYRNGNYSSTVSLTNGKFETTYGTAASPGTYRYFVEYLGDENYSSAVSKEFVMEVLPTPTPTPPVVSSSQGGSTLVQSTVATISNGTGGMQLGVTTVGGQIPPQMFSELLNALNSSPGAGILFQNPGGPSIALTGEQMGELLSGNNDRSIGFSTGSGSVAFNMGAIPLVNQPLIISLNQLQPPAPPTPSQPPQGAKTLSAVNSEGLHTADLASSHSLTSLSLGNITETVEEVAYQFTVKTGNTVLSELKMPATLRLLYSLPTGADANALTAYYVKEDGERILVSGYYDESTGAMIIRSKQCGTYVISYQPVSFLDIEQKVWYQDFVSFLGARKLMTGTKKGQFYPDAAMTRAKIVTILGKLSGVDADAYKTSSFTDVKAGGTFQPYIEWAYKNGIIQGEGKGKFNPNRAVTREETALILQNYAKTTSYSLPDVHKSVVFTDSKSIGKLYMEAVQAMQTSGIMSGKDNGNFNPKSVVTRGEFSAILYRYIRLTIEPDTAQGWALNDDGQHMYYQEGNALTGWQDIEGNRYYFDVWGAEAAGKWLQIDGKWYYFNTDGSLARSTKIDGYEVDENGVRKTS